jgi:hypothetical protein
MSFLAPWILAALPAVAVPVIIHLLNRGKPRPIKWAAMQFLLDSVRKNQRRLQLRDLILLILRALVVLFLVLLFARPAFWTSAGSSGVIPSPVAGMIVLDVSASMSQSDGRRSRLELAREEAIKTLDKFNADSLCGLILATDRAVPAVPRPSNNLELVRNTLNSVQGTSSATDLLPAIDRAMQELTRSPGLEKIVFVYTDSQQSAWRDSTVIRDLAKKYPGISLRSVPVGRTGEPNTAITGIAIQPAAPTVGESAKVRVDVQNLTENPLAGIRISLATNRDQPQDEATLPPIPANGSASAEMKITYDAAGLQTLRAQIPQDLFPADNQRSLAVRVGDSCKFLIVANSVVGDRRATAEFFLRTALKATQKGAKIEIVLPSGLTAAQIAAASAVFVAAPGSLDDNQWAQLEKFTREGGGIVVFSGNTSSSSLGATPATQWLPGTLGNPLSKPATWVQNTLSHPVTVRWSDPNQMRLTNINSDARLELTPHKGAIPLATYSDGVPVAVSSDVGSGRAVLFGMSPVPDSTQLVLHPFFPILLGSLVDYLAVEQHETPTLKPGETFSAVVPPALMGRKVTLANDRNDERVDAGLVASAGDQGRIHIPAVESPGGYRVFVAGDDAAVCAFAVVLDPTESVLATSQPVEITASPSEAQAPGAAPTASQVKVPHEAWTAFAFLLLLLFTVELLLAHRFTMIR